MVCHFRCVTRPDLSPVPQHGANMISCGTLLPADPKRTLRNESKTKTCTHLPQPPIEMQGNARTELGCLHTNKSRRSNTLVSSLNKSTSPVLEGPPSCEVSSTCNYPGIFIRLKLSHFLCVYLMLYCVSCMNCYNIKVAQQLRKKGYKNINAPKRMTCRGTLKNCCVVALQKTNALAAHMQETLHSTNILDAEVSQVVKTREFSRS